MAADPLLRYTETASHSAGVVISHYSTSFGLACRLLGPARRDVENIYALVRVADEAVDGAAAAAGLDPAAVGEQLDRLERETESAMATGYSTNMVVHAFAGTARRTGISTDLTRPFFAAMRADLTTSVHSEASLGQYIYGSAEVVGLMCLRVFQNLPGAVQGYDDELAAGARRLGAAFQKVNFLRDLAADSRDLGRTYFPMAAESSEAASQGSEASQGSVASTVPPSPMAPGRVAGSFQVLTEDRKRQLVTDIRADLAAAQDPIRLLAPRARLAVDLARSLFCALADRLAETPASDLSVRRVRVPPAAKAVIALRVLADHSLKPSLRHAATKAAS